MTVDYADQMCVDCYKDFKSWALSTLTLDPRKLRKFWTKEIGHSTEAVAAIDFGRLDVEVAFDQWLEQGRP